MRVSRNLLKQPVLSSLQNVLCAPDLPPPRKRLLQSNIKASRTPGPSINGDGGMVSVSPSTSLLDDVRTLFHVLHDAPELNPSNYDHEQACELNAAMCEAFALCRDLLQRVSSNAESEAQDELSERS